VLERYTILARDGLREVGPADAVILSLNAEAASSCGIAGWAMWWTSTAFGSPMPGGLQDLAARELRAGRAHRPGYSADYRALIDLIWSQAPATRILICNMMSTSGMDDIQSYAPLTHRSAKPCPVSTQRYEPDALRPGARARHRRNRCGLHRR